VTDDGKRRRAEAGARNLAKWREEHPEGGGLTHGARSRTMARKFGDRRTREGRMLEEIMAGVIADFGGPANISGSQAVLLARIREKTSIILRIASYIDTRQRDIISPDGELISVLRHGYLSYAESVRRDLETVTLTAARKPFRAPSLEEYLKNRARTAQEGEKP
jgi:hypothetical protein